MCSKILFPCHSVVGMCSCILPLLAARIFFVECPVLSVLFYPVSFIFQSSFFRHYLLVYFLKMFVLFVELLFSFYPNMFQDASSVFAFLLIVVNFLSAFPVEFHIQVLTFCSCSLGEHHFFSQTKIAPALIIRSIP